MKRIPRRDSVHTPDDGRGLRRIFVDGHEIKQVFYADTLKGIVRHYNDPPKAHKHGKRIVERTVRGAVTIAPLD